MKPRILLLGSLAASLLLAAPGAVRAGVDQQKEARARWFAAELARADSLLAVGQARRVADRLGSILEKAGEDPLYAWQLRERLGVAKLQLGDPTGALAELEASARAHADRSSVHRNLATTLMALGRRGRALSEFRQAVELAPRDCDIRLEFGQVLLEFRNTAEAAVHLQRAAELCGDRREVRLALANLKLQTGAFEEAAGLLAGLDAESPDPTLLQNLQAALLGAGRDRELIDLMRSLPTDRLDERQLQVWIETEGRLQAADLARQQVLLLEESPESALPARLGLDAAREARFWATATLNLLGADEPAAALRAADRAIELEPGNVVYRNNRVVALSRLGREDEARREWKRVLELDPSLAQPGGAGSEDGAR